MIEKNTFFMRHTDYLDLFFKLIEKFVIPYHQAQITGLERIPDVPLLYIGNHNGAMLSVDSFIFLSFIHKKFGINSYYPYYMIHNKLLKMPVIGALLEEGGAIRASHDNAHKLLVEGHKIMAYPGGDLESMRPFSQRNKIKFSGRDGYIRLALRENIPIVPVVTAGAHSVYMVIDDMQWLAKLIHSEIWLQTHAWPLTLSIPWGLTLGPVLYFHYPAKITIEVLEPVYFERVGEKAATDQEWVKECALRIETIMQTCLTKITTDNLINDKNYKCL